jgi:hypothetical protein
MTGNSKRVIPVDDYLALENQRGSASDGKDRVLQGLATRRVCLQLPEDLPLDDWQRIGERIAVTRESSSWWLGDWLIHGESAYPDRYQHALAALRLDYQTLRNYAWVCRRFSPARRRSSLSFQHHAELAALSPAEQDRWLDRAEQCRWSRNTLRKQIHQRPDSLPAQIVALSIVATPEQQQRWQAAADQVDRTLIDWISEVLDQAAVQPGDDAAGA